MFHIAFEMEEISSDTENYSVFDDGHVLSKTDWSHVLDNEVDITRWKGNDIKIHANKAKMNYLIN